MPVMKREHTDIPHHRPGLFSCEFDAINTPGLYIENRTGILLRIPEDALVPGRSPAIEILSNDTWIVTKISDDPFMPVTKARMIAADLDIRTNF